MRSQTNGRTGKRANKGAGRFEASSPRLGLGKNIGPKPEAEGKVVYDVVSLHQDRTDKIRLTSGPECSRVCVSCTLNSLGVRWSP